MRVTNSTEETELLSIEQIVDKLISDDNTGPNEYCAELFSLSAKSGFSGFKNTSKLIESISKIQKIEDAIIQEIPDENGGVIAMQGFYYQLLITVGYVIEMAQGKWDRIVVDRHQDIIAFKDDTIRFIQVKTRKDSHCSVSDTDAYFEWIPKLFSLQNKFENLGCKLEFELVSNCNILNAPTACKNFENYHNNNFFENGLVDGDLYKKISQSCKKNIGYQLTENKIKTGLKAFKFTHQSAEHIEMLLSVKIGRLFSEILIANQEILDLLISHLFKKCYYPESASIQLVNNHELELILKEIQKKIQVVGEAEILSNSADEIVGVFSENIIRLYASTNFQKEFSQVVTELGDDVISHITESQIDTIVSIINKFYEKSFRSDNFRIGQLKRLDDAAEILMKTLLFIKIYFGGCVSFDSNNLNLLLIKVNNRSFNLFGVKEEYGMDLQDAVNEFTDVFHNLQLSDQIAIVKEPSIKIVIAGQFDTDGKSIDSVEVTCTPILSNPQIEVLSDLLNPSIALVSNTLSVIDGESQKIEKIQKRRNRFADIPEMRNFIKEVLNFE